MAEGLHLIGYGPSVYTRIARFALVEMELRATYIEADPFAQAPDPILAQLSPFGRVPILRHGEFTLTETGAILRYLDHLSAKPSLIPQDGRAEAQMTQVISIVDFYGYLPLVRDVFVHGYLAEHTGEVADPERLQSGLEAAQPVLQALNTIAGEGRVLGGGNLTLADIHLAPMIDYFTKVPAALQALDGFESLSQWWDSIRRRPAFLATDCLSRG